MADNAAVAGNGNYVDFYNYKGKYSGIAGWLLSVDHKRIGLMYLYSMVTFS
ncbi:hypothetical protein MASR1M45_09040 [Candidatus Kapaibacterium sp.]